MPPESDITIGELTRAIARMEIVLGRIDAKLDAKADRTELVEIKGQLREIERLGSREAQEALALAKQLEERVASLEKGESGLNAIQRYKGWLLALGIGLLMLITLVLSNTYSLHH
jgi:hypothetical protein